MKLAWVTAAFLGAREDRPASYYLEPLARMVTRLEGSPFRLVVWTWEQSLPDVLAAVPEAYVHVCDPLQLCLRASPDYRWRLLGRDLHARPHDMMCRYTDMLAIYLSRVGIIERTMATFDVDACLWFDAGWVNSVLHRCDDDVFAAWRPREAAETLERLLDRYGLLLCWKQGLRDALTPYAAKWGVKMECFTQGGIWACRRDLIAGFADRVAAGWRELLSGGTLQDDECAMTLAMWVHGIPAIRQDAWYHLICGAQVEPEITPWLVPSRCCLGGIACRRSR